MAREIHKQALSMCLVQRSEWEEVAELFPDDPDGDDDKFGYSVAIEGDTIIAGAPYHPAGDNNSGAAYVFEYNDINCLGIQDRTFWHRDIEVGDKFGYSVAIDGNTYRWLAPFHDVEFMM